MQFDCAFSVENHAFNHVTSLKSSVTPASEPGVFLVAGRGDSNFFLPMFIHLFLQQVFNQCLLCARHKSRECHKLRCHIADGNEFSQVCVGKQHIFLASLSNMIRVDLRIIKKKEVGSHVCFVCLRKIWKRKC